MGGGGGGEGFEKKMGTAIFFTTLTWIISHSKKNLAKYD
jgi:hypothetical protein